MSAYKNTYVGIYLEVPHKKVEKKTIFYKDPETGERMKSKFNPETGVEGLKDERIANIYEVASPYIIDENYLREDMFWCPAYHAGDYYVGKNKFTTFLLNNDFENDVSEIANFDLSKINIKKELNDFKEKYSKYLDYFKNKYGDIRIYYGVVNYAH